MPLRWKATAAVSAFHIVSGSRALRLYQMAAALLADSPQFILARVANAEALLMMASSFSDHFLFQYTIVLFLFLSMLLWSLFAVIFQCLFFNLRRD